MKHRAVGIILWAGLAVSPFSPIRAEDAEAPAPDRSAAIQKNFVASKHALKEYCKQTNPGQAATFDEAWANYLKIESPEMNAYAATPEFTAASAEVLKEFTREAQRGGAALESLAKTCQLTLDSKKL